MMTATLGKTPGYSGLIKVAETAMNYHILITGKSGSGKTVALQKIEKGIVFQGGNVLVLNFNGTHSLICKDKDVNYIMARKDGIPLSFLKPIRDENGLEEDINDVVDAAVDVFYLVKKLSKRQRSSLSTAMRYAVENRENYADDFKSVVAGLNIENCENKLDVMEHFDNIFLKAIFCANRKLFEPGKITVLDLSEFSGSNQKILAEMVLSTLWRYFRVGGQHAQVPLYVVCDEFQALNLSDNSVLNQILREGRKFNLSLLLATQTLSTFEKEKQVILQQAGTHLYFRPVECDFNKIVREISSINPQSLKEILMGLGIGECLATGILSIGKTQRADALRMSFRE